MPIIDPRRSLLLRLAWRVEGEFPDVQECTTTDDPEDPDAIVETRPEYLRIYRHTEIRTHPDGSPFALVLDDEAREKLVDVRNEIGAKVAAGSASQEEQDIAVLPDEVDLDASWEPPPP